MTQSVAPKTSIPEKTWRRQTDSPSGWIAFSCGSVILHLLAFWLIGSYKLSTSQSGSSSAVPIEFIEISPQKSPSEQPKSQPQPKPQPKPVSPKPAPAKPIVPQNSQPVVKPPVSTTDRDAIAFDNQEIEQQLAEQQRYSLLQQQQLAQQQRQLEIEQQRQQELEQQRLRAEELKNRLKQQQELEARISQQEQEQQRILDEKLRQQEVEQQSKLKQQRQQEVEQQRLLETQLQQEVEQQRLLETQRQQEEAKNSSLSDQVQQEVEQRELARQSKLKAEEQRKLATGQLQNPADGEKIADAPRNADGEELPSEFDKKASQAPIQNQPNQSGGILTASWNIDNRTFKEKPTNLAKPQKRINSDIPLPPPQDGNFQPGSFLVWLTIDIQGNLISVEVDKQIQLAQRSQYQEYAEEIFKGQKFIPASESNGSKPPLSYLPIIINIEESSN